MEEKVLSSLKFSNQQRNFDPVLQRLVISRFELQSTKSGHLQYNI